MKKLFTLLSLLLAGAGLGYAQIPNGSVAPNFTAVDINGNSHNLYNLLNQGKTVYMDVFATWCGPCWNYHQTHALADLWDQYGPSATNEAFVLGIEGDASTSVQCITNSPGCVGGTLGDWTQGTPYPIADYSPIMNLYQVNYYPTIFMVCPADKKVYEVGQQSTAGLWASRAALCPPLVVNTTVNNVQNVRCHGTNTGSIDISVSGGLPPYTYQWSNGASTQDLVNIPAGTYTCTITNAQGWMGTTDPITVEEPLEPLSLTLVSTTPVGCNGILGSIEVAAYGGWFGYTFQWSNGSYGTEISSLNAGNYICTVTDDGGCTKTLSTPLAPPSIPSASIAPPSTLTCINDTIQLTASGAGGYSGTYNFQWFVSNGGHITNGANTATPGVDSAGTYTVQVSDMVTTCAGFASTSVTAQQNYPVSNAGPDATLTCSSPTVTLAGSGSQGANIAYLWTAISGGHIVSGGESLTPLIDSVGSYILMVTNIANGCVKRDTAVVSGNNVPPQVAAVGDSLTCVSNEATLLATTNAASPGYSWEGPNGFTSNLPDPVASDTGLYLLTVLDSLTGCINVDSAFVGMDTAPPGAEAIGGTLTCTTTSVMLQGASPVSNASFAWSGPNGFVSNEPAPIATGPGQYDLLVTNTGNGCTSTATATVDQNTSAPIAGVNAPGTLNCNVPEIVLDGSGSSQGAGFTYLWTTADGNIVSGETTANPTVDAAGAYDLMVTDQTNGCTAVAATQVIQNGPVSADITVDNQVNCHGGDNGAATVIPTGGNGVYTYLWSNGNTTATASGLTAGTYTVIATDGENCTAESSVAINEPPALEANATGTAQTANGVNDGVATASPAGGTGAYTFSWNNGETTQTITGLAPGIYTVTVTDENGCTAAQSAIVNAFNCVLSGTADGTDVTCFGATDGSAEALVSGANLPAQYAWSNGETTQAISNLAPGIYTVGVLDEANCALILEVTITEPDELQTNAAVTHESGPGAGDGTATVNPSGGTGAYSYVWSTGETMQSITGLSPGLYTVIVTDANGCTGIQTVEVEAYSCAVSAQTTVSDISCAGMNDGAITLAMNGGSEPYTYVWSTGESTASLANLAAGVYTATVTDANDCELVVEQSIAEPEPVTLAGNASNPVCANDETGSVAVQVAGGVGDYVYLWSNGETQSTIDGLLPGTYTVTVSDANNCLQTAEFMLDADDNLSPVITAQNISLPLNASGLAIATLQSLNATVTDNCAVASVIISPSSFDCAGLGDQSLTITAQDDAGNESSVTILVTVVDNLPPVVTCPESITRCWYDNVVQYNAPVAQDNCLSNGGEWALEEGLPSGSEFPTGETVQTYAFRDASGNTGLCSFVVTITSPLFVTQQHITDDQNNQGGGAIDITVEGGKGPYEYTWTNEAGQVVGTSEDLNGLIAGSYAVEIRDANGCILKLEGLVVSNTTATLEPEWLQGALIRPNPTSGLADIVLAAPLLVSLEISVIDATGRIVQSLLIDQQQIIRLDCTGLPEGAYWVRFRTGSETGGRKLIVSR